MLAPSQELTAAEMHELTRAVVAEITSAPPTIGVIGTSGTGKSSTLNAMFKTGLATSHVTACTKEFCATDLDVTMTQGNTAGRPAILRVVDAPGLGEDVTRDPEYLHMYRKHLSQCDVILWVLQARNRAIALDQMYLRQLTEFHSKIVFGINQVDLVEPRNWDARTNLPSEEQERHIQEIIQDRSQRLSAVMQRDVSAVAYSAAAPYNLQELFTSMVESCPDERAWIFSAIKGFRPDDFLPAAARARVMGVLDARQSVELGEPTRTTPKLSPASPHRRLPWYQAVIDWAFPQNSDQR